ncbi:hypothetical protein SLEP1_g37069 [Rubroshorea leprosula]|uniref:Reverse transcriptase domain-containing protein n=1 Tax=Rubroshorea leprosula TaxID=152421 RepID=A0AAV5KTU8_9ROSI|nr:hypothetical protein SLEP1_g37069 [Rubroshorea leprosula]
MATVRGGRGQHGNGNGKSSIGFKEFVNRLPAFDKGLLKQCVSYHFYNFPDDWGAKNLFFFIRKTVKAGRLWDIFIPSRRDRRGNRYGFARFLDARNEREMKKQLENIWIGNHRVIFNPAEERREEKGRTESRQKNSTMLPLSEESTKVDEGRRQAPKLTYAQCLLQQNDKAKCRIIENKGPTPSEAKGFPRNANREPNKVPSPGGVKYKKVIELKGTDKAEENLMKCAVGVVLSPSVIPNLPEIFFNEGYPSTKIAPMGDAARILVSTKSKSVLNEEFVLKVKNSIFHITLVEENWRTDPWWLKKVESSNRESDACSSAFNFNDESSEVDGDYSNGPEEDEIQTPFRDVNNINCSDKLCVSKTFVEVCKANRGAQSNHDCGKQSEAHGGSQTSGGHTSESRVPALDNWIAQVAAQSGSPIGSERKTHLASNKKEMDQEECGIQVNASGPQVNVSPNKSLNTPREVRMDSMKLVTGTKRGRRRKVLNQPANFNGKASKGSLSDSDIVCNNKRIKEGLILDEAKKMLEFGSKLGIETRNREDQILESFRQMEERDRQGSALAIYGLWGEKKQKCCIVNVYASCNRNEREETWAKLLRMIEEEEGYWCIAGDFNSVRSAEERRGRSEYSRNREDLNGFIETAGLVDLPLTRRRFTWYKGDGSAMSRSISDHCPVILKKVNSDWGPKPFRVLNCWDQHPDFIRVVEENWNSTKVEGWKGFVCKEKFKHKNEDIEISEEDILMRKEGFNELWEAWKRREVAWKQKTKLDWVQQGDANSKLFHRIASSNRLRKLIRGIHKDNSWVEEPSSVKKEVRQYFQKIFQEEQWDRPKLDGLQFKQLDDEDRAWLERDVSVEEVKQAVWECGGDKSPGPDGFSFHLIRTCWRVIEKDIVDFVQEFSKNGKLVKGLNSSFIVLVPKKSNPVELKDYRPISLISSLYKIISKVLANRIKKVLPKVISETQSAFLGGRQITDGILILNEVAEEIRRKKASSFMFKEDFEKAYDSSISILVNGSPTDEFKMERGIRQGDPIAPFLFLIVAEGLNILIESATRKGLFQGIDVGPHGLNISHLQFADDTVIMGKANTSNINVVKGILRWFELISGLKINFNKSVLYSFYAPDEWRRTAAAMLNCKSGSLPFTYLGMPIGDVMCRRKAWVPVIENFNRKLAVWKAKCLSIGGRVTLLRSEGGLGVPDIENRNIALLGKWWDRFGKEENSLWKKVIVDKYYGGGMEWDIEHTEARNVSTLWRNIVALGTEGGNVTIMEMGHYSNGSRSLEHSWRREPFGRERDEEQRLNQILLGEVVQSSQPDRRSWSFDTGNGYTIDMKIDIEVISKEAISPSSPTAVHLRRYQLSFLDQFNSPVFMPLVMFYSRENCTSNVEQCVHFVEAKGNCCLSDILNCRDPSANNYFFPLELDDATAAELPTMVQLTFFECGGLAVSLGMSHKPRAQSVKENIMTKRIVFNARFMASTQTETDRVSEIYTIGQTVNLRSQMDPPLSNRYFGNIYVSTFTVPWRASEGGFHGIVKQIRDATRKVNSELVKKLVQRTVDECLYLLTNPAVDSVNSEVVHLHFTSLCRFPMYEVHFGWGKLVWVGSTRWVFKNLICFFDTRSGDGIEAWINLKEVDMAKFQSDEDFLSYASLSSNV